MSAVSGAHVWRPPSRCSSVNSLVSSYSQVSTHSVLMPIRNVCIMFLEGSRDPENIQLYVEKHICHLVHRWIIKSPTPLSFFPCPLSFLAEHSWFKTDAFKPRWTCIRKMMYFLNPCSLNFSFCSKYRNFSQVQSWVPVFKQTLEN